jgi:hypothetical protein
MSIQIIDNFKLNLAFPLDSRMITNGKSSRNSIKYVYEGLRVYDIVEKTPYVWLDGSWQKESSVGVAGSGVSTTETSAAPPPPPPVITTNRLVKYTSATTIGESSIFDKGTFLIPNVGIGKIPSNGLALDVVGMIKANRFVGTINGNNFDINSIVSTKIKPHSVNSGEFALKTIGSQVVWSSEVALNLDIVVANQTANLDTHYLLFADKSVSTTGTRIYSNSGTGRLIGVKPSTSQILASNNINNNKSAPGYSFSGTTNSGLFGSSTEVGLSFGGNSLLKLNSSSLSIYDTTGNLVLSTGTNKVICTTGEFGNTINVSGLTTVLNLIVSTGTNTFQSLTPTTLNVTGTVLPTTINNLIVDSTTTSTFPSLSTSILNATKLKTLNLDAANGMNNPLRLKSLTVNGTLDVLDPNDWLLLNGGPGFIAVLTNCDINGIVSNVNTQLGIPTITNPLTINAGSNGDSLTGITALNPAKFSANWGGYVTQDLAPHIKYTGAAKFKSLNLIGNGVNLSGTLYTSKLRFIKTKDSIVADDTKIYISSIVPEIDYWPPINSTPQSYPGYEPGDIIFVSWTQPSRTNVYSKTKNQYINVPSQKVGYHLFFCGRDKGWAFVNGAGNTAYNGDPYQIIRPNLNPDFGGGGGDGSQPHIGGQVLPGPLPPPPPPPGTFPTSPVAGSGGNLN